VSARLFPGKIFEKCFEKKFRPVFQKKISGTNRKKFPVFPVFFLMGGLRLNFFGKKSPGFSDCEPVKDPDIPLSSPPCTTSRRRTSGAGVPPCHTPLPSGNSLLLPKEVHFGRFPKTGIFR